MKYRGSCFVASALISHVGLLSHSVIAISPIDSSDFRSAVTVANIRAHQQALQVIADDNGGTRASGTAGYDESAAYVADVMQSYGYSVTLQEFEFEFVGEVTPSVFNQVAPNATTYAHNDPAGFFTFQYSGNGDVTASVQAVDLILPAPTDPNTSTSGCEAADFAGFIPGNIALLQRGTCMFGVKVANAEAAGAVGVIIFNEGQPGRTAATGGTLSSPKNIPVVGTSFAIGEILAGTAGATVRLKVDMVREMRKTVNVLAETGPGCGDSVLMLGAHLDSVLAGPGLQDNGSGSATILELAVQLAGLDQGPRRTVRFAWWGAEEWGLLGSRYYVNNLSQEELDRIALYLNFDMIASPNFVRFVYDGDGSLGGFVGPTGSAEAELVFQEYFAALGLPVEQSSLELVRSDQIPFMEAGVAVGGLFTGAEGIKTAQQAAVYGGTAGQQYDPCYHLACDTFANVSLEALDQMSDAAAHALLTYALDPTLCFGNRVSASQKGSLLIFSDVELAWRPGGPGEDEWVLIQDTIVELTNDYPESVDVQLYFVNGDRPLDEDYAGDPPMLIVEREPGWNWVDCQFRLTQDQPTYWSAATGLPAGCQPFTVLDPDGGNGPGRPDAENIGRRVLRGFIYAWAVDNAGNQIAWNHLSGSATVINYADQSAWEYEAFGFQSRVTLLGERVGTPGLLFLDGLDYDFAYDMLLMDFFASGSQALSSPPNVVTVDTDLTLHVVSADLRQDSDGPITTKAEFAIWNENERRFSGTTRCITCWDQTLLSRYQSPNHFLLHNLQTDRGKARISGVASTQCDVNCFFQPAAGASGFTAGLSDFDFVCSEDAPILGVAAKELGFSGIAAGRTTAGGTLIGQGHEMGYIAYDIIEPPGSMKADPKRGRGR